MIMLRTGRFGADEHKTSPEDTNRQSVSPLFCHKMAIERLLKNLENWDKDERYMACSDMIVELQKGLKIDAATELR